MRDNNYLKEMGLKIKKARMAKKIYMRDLAPLCGIHHTAICEIELGRYDSRILTLKAIADALGVDVKEFL